MIYQNEGSRQVSKEIQHATMPPEIFKDMYFGTYRCRRIYTFCQYFWATHSNLVWI